MNTTNLTVYLPFDTSTTADLCGNSWTAYGSPTISEANAISGKALQLDGQSYLQLPSVQLGGRDFTVCGYCYTHADCAGGARVFNIHLSPDTGNALVQLRHPYPDSGNWRLVTNTTAAVSSNTMNTQDSGVDPKSKRHHFEVVYRYAAKTMTFFIDGIQKAQYTNCPQFQRQNFVVDLGTQKSSSGETYSFTGSIDEFQIYDGVALHTGNFTPPTDSDYADLKFALGEETVPVSYTFDVERRVTNAPNINEDTPPQLYLNGTSNNYATLPTFVSPAQTEFTIEIAFSTRSTRHASEDYFADTIIGRDIPLKADGELNLRVQDGCLLLWGSADDNIVTDKFVADGQIHKAAIVSHANGAADLYCDGELVGHTENFNYRPDSSRALGIAFDLNNSSSRVAMNLYEVRLWNTAREEIFADIDGSESGLQGWYIPTENGLTDYSPNIKHATVTGTVNYSEVNTVFVDVDYESTNDALGWRYEDCAIYFGTGAPINFHVPPTAEIWVRFDVYFDGVSRWYAYDNGIYGMTGITSQTSLALDFLSADLVVRTLPDICKAKVTQTFLLHMVSGVADGLIEVWCGLEKIGVYNGNVNNGRQFSDFKLRSDAVGTSFTELIISNSELQPDEKPANTVRATKTSCLNTCNTKTEKIWLEKGGDYPFPYLDLTIRDVMRQIITETIEGEGEFSPITTIWLKFDVYFDGINRWAAYNIDETNGKCGVFAELPLDFKYLANDFEVVRGQTALMANHWQTVILHMASAPDSSGLIEVWIDDVKMHVHSGNVNNGDEFTNLYLTSEGGGTIFKNFIASSATLTENNSPRVVASGVPQLTFNVWHNGEVISVPLQCSLVPITPALAIRWCGCDWYNPLVLPTDNSASEIAAHHSGANYALSYF